MKYLVQASAKQIVLKNDVFVTWLAPQNFAWISENIVSFSELWIENEFSPRGPSWLGGGRVEGNRLQTKPRYHLSNSFVTENTLC